MVIPGVRASMTLGRQYRAVLIKETRPRDADKWAHVSIKSRSANPKR